MQTPLRITCRHMTNSPALEARLREQVDHLARSHDHIIGCEVVVGAPTAHHQNGAPFELRINLTVPDGDLHVHNEHAVHPQHTDVYVAVRDTFAALERMLKKRASTRHRPRAHPSIRKNSSPAGPKTPTS